MNIKGMSREQLKALRDQIRIEIASLGGQGNGKNEKARMIAEELKPFTDNIFAAKEAYIAKGFNVEIKTNKKNGLVTKWVLKRNPNASAGRTMTVDEFKSILGRLGDGELKSSDIQNALIESGIGARKLQPTLGNILRGMYGPLIEKANDEVRGPGVRYRKVK